jgi:thiamine biosynthesis lipoprotein
MPDPVPSRRDFLTGRALAGQVAAAGEALADALVADEPPTRGPTLLLRTTAMATDFDVLLNPDGPHDQVAAASTALDLLPDLEQQLTVYRDDSELMQLNRNAVFGPVAVDAPLFDLLQRAAEISRLTDGAFDPAGGAAIRLWRDCRRAGRVPSADEVTAAVSTSGLSHVQFDAAARTVAFDRPGVEFNLGAIGKGYAVDRVGECLLDHGVEQWLVHGGKSSVRARGAHAGHDGWPIGLQNPLLPDRPVLTLLLKDAALGTSGTAVQWFRHAGKRYGHILDPRTGWPVEAMLSVSVIAQEAALADALSTAFFVLGVENALRCCDNFPTVGAILFPVPEDGRTVAPRLHNVPAESVFWVEP